MRVALVTYERSGVRQALSSDERAALQRSHEALSRDSRCVGGAMLEPAGTATAVRRSDGETVTADCTVAAEDQILTGYYLFEVSDREEAIELAVAVPAARVGGSVEIRTLVQL